MKLKIGRNRKLASIDLFRVPLHNAPVLSHFLLPRFAALFSSQDWVCRLQFPGFLGICSLIGLASGKVRKKKPDYFFSSLSALAVSLPTAASSPGFQCLPFNNSPWTLILPSPSFPAAIGVEQLSAPAHSWSASLYYVWFLSLSTTYLTNSWHICREVSGFCFPVRALTIYTIHMHTYMYMYCLILNLILFPTPS